MQWCCSDAAPDTTASMTADLTKALCAFHRDVSTIHKEANAQYGKYADLATVLSTVLPALSKNGLAVVQTFEPAQEPGDQVLVTTLLHTSGERIESRLPLVVPKGRNPLHDWGGATTYSRRYALLAILSLAAGIEDDDGDYANTAAPTTASTSKPPAKRASSPNPEKLSAAEVQELVQAVLKVSEERRAQIVLAFQERFSLPPDKKAADYIKTAAHRDFLMEQLHAAVA
jgi:hypothetical protein